MGFEPTRAEPIGLAVQRLNHSATSSLRIKRRFDPGRTRTCNPLIRSQMPYPLGHRANVTVYPEIVAIELESGSMV